MDGTQSAPLRAIFIKGPRLFGKRKIYDKVIFQPCVKEIETVFVVRRCLNKIIETTINLTKETFQLESPDTLVIELLDPFHSQDVLDGCVDSRISGGSRSVSREMLVVAMDGGAGVKDA